MLYSENQWVIAHTYKKWSNTMLKSPVLSVPVQRALAGSAVTGGADQSSATSIGWGHVSEGADQSSATSIGWGHVSEGADQSSATSIGWGHVSEGADQANFSSWAHWGPSEG